MQTNLKIEEKQTSADGLKLLFRYYDPGAGPKAVLCLVHGIGEHSGRYHDWMNRFVQQDYACIMFDQRGHGLSEGKKGHIPSMDMIKSDIDLLLKQSEIRHPGIPVILYGHSLGGSYVLNYAIDRQPEIKALLVTSPWLTLINEVPKPVVAVVRVINKIFPGMLLKSSVDPGGISRNQEVVNEYVNDPLVHKKLSVRLFCEAYNYGRLALKNPDKINIPLLLMHGGADTITDPRSSKQFADGNTRFISYKVWPGLYHETHNEFEYMDVFNFIINWLESQF